MYEREIDRFPFVMIWKRMAFCSACIFFHIEDREPEFAYTISSSSYGTDPYSLPFRLFGSCFLTYTFPDLVLLLLCLIVNELY